FPVITGVEFGHQQSKIVFPVCCRVGFDLRDQTPGPRYLEYLVTRDCSHRAAESSAGPSGDDRAEAAAGPRLPPWTLPASAAAKSASVPPRAPSPPRTRQTGPGLLRSELAAHRNRRR